MASLFVTAFTAAGMAITSPVDMPANADELAQPEVTVVRGGCERAVVQALEMTGGELLSVQPARNGRPICKVTVLVLKANGRPRRIKLRIPMDF